MSYCTLKHFVKKMDLPAPKIWKVGNVCTCRTLTCCIEDITKSSLGTNIYKIKFVDSGDVDHVPKHMLHPIDGFEEDDDDDFVPSVNIPVENICASDKEKNYDRYLNLIEEEIDDISKSRLSKHTEKQTKWAVCLFKGKCWKKMKNKNGNVIEKNLTIIVFFVTKYTLIEKNMVPRKTKK